MTWRRESQRHSLARRGIKTATTKSCAVNKVPVKKRLLKEKTFTFIVDDGHGYLVVPTSSLKALGLEDKITHFSYFSKDKKNVYLEEDDDANTFISAMKRKKGVKVEFDFERERSAIKRGMKRYFKTRVIKIDMEK